MGVFCDILVWPKFYVRIWCTVCAIVLYGIAIYRQSTDIRKLSHQPGGLNKWPIFCRWHFFLFLERTVPYFDFSSIELRSLDSYVILWCNLFGFQSQHDSVMTCTRVPLCRPFVMRIHRSPVDSSDKGPVIYSFNVFFDVSLNPLWKKQSSCRRFETP